MLKRPVPHRRTIAGPTPRARRRAATRPSCRILLWLLGFPLIPGLPSGLEPPVMAQQRPATLHTGDHFHQQLATTVGVSWTETPLRQVLQHVPERWGLALFLDRRVDPDQLVHFQSANQSLARTLQALAEELGLEVAWIDHVIYLGPPGVPQRLATLADIALEEVQAVPGRAQVAARRLPLRWETPAEPRELVRQVAESAGLEVMHLERIPHDLWWENQLPPLPWPCQLSILLAGFDLTFTLSPDGTRLDLVPLATDGPRVRTYAVPSHSAPLIRRLQTEYPAARLQRAGNRLQVEASLAEHEGIRRLLEESAPRATAAARAGAGRTAPAGSAVRYTLRATNRLGVILQAVAQRSELQVEFPPELQPQLGKNVTLEVEDVSLEELLDRLLLDHGLTYQLQPPRLKVEQAR